MKLQHFTTDELSLLNPAFRKGEASYNTLKNNISRNRRGGKVSFQTFAHPENGNKIVIDYTSIPEWYKVGNNLPIDYKEARDIVKERLNSIATPNKGVSGASEFHVANILQREIEANFCKYISNYAAAYNNNVALAEKYSREHALRVACTKVTDYTVKELHQGYLYLSTTGTQNNYYKFSHLLNHQWITDEGVSLVHGHKGKVRTDLKKLSDTHIALIEELYKHPNQYSHALITELLNIHCKKEGLPTVVRRTVTSHLQRPEVYNRLLIFRNKEAYGKKVKPINRRIAALNPGDLYYMDGSPAQISCMNREGTKEIRPTIFVVLDSCTWKIAGWCIAESEDRYTWFGAMKMAFSIEGALPHEIVYDNASATGTPEFKALTDKLLLNGCKMRAAKPGEPTAKAQVERWFGVFQNSYQRMIDGFTGEGIRSKRETGRIDAEFLKKVRKQNGVFTFDSFVELFSLLIAAYNQKGSPKHPNPSKIFAESSKPNIQSLSPEKLALLFWNSRPITIRNSEVKMTIRHVEYFYSVNDYTLNGQTVKVYYDETDLSSVYLFGSNDECICEAKQKVLFHEAQVNQSPKDINQIMGQASHNKAVERNLLQHGKERTEAAKNAFGDEYLKLVNPLEMLKDEFNNAETEQVLQYVRDNNSIDQLKVNAYSPVQEIPTIEKKYSKKHTPRNPSLEVVDEI